MLAVLFVQLGRVDRDRHIGEFERPFEKAEVGVAPMRVERRTGPDGVFVRKDAPWQ